MITEGIITELNYTTNTCSVRIPIFENVSSPDKIIVESKIVVQPGTYNGYKVNDTVWVGFVDMKFDQPIILGKIYKGPTEEHKTEGGQLNVAGINVSGTSATLPQDTIITGTDDYNSFKAIIDELKSCKNIITEQTTKIMELEDKVKDLSAQLGETLTDAAGEILADSSGEILSPRRAEEVEQNK